MKLTKAEKYALILSLLFIFLALGFHLGSRSSEPLTVITEKSAEAPAAEETDSETQDASPEGAVNINSADMEELMRLDGIGEVLAQRIIDYREEHGPFESIGDITNVSGIGAKKFEAIREHITVS